MFNHLRSLFANLEFNDPKSAFERQKKKRSVHFGYEALEPRQLLHGSGLFTVPVTGEYIPGHRFTVTSINSVTSNVAEAGNASVTVSGEVTNASPFTPGGHVGLNVQELTLGGSATLVARNAAGQDVSLVSTADKTVVRVTFTLGLANLSPGIYDLQYRVIRTGQQATVLELGSSQNLSTRILVNQRPTAQVTNVSVVEDTTTSGTLVRDLDDSDLTINVTVPPVHGLLEVNKQSSGVYTYTYTPGLDRDASTSFTYTAFDGHTTISKTVNLNLTAVNDGPRWATDVIRQATPGSAPLFINPTDGLVDPEGNPIDLSTLELSKEQSPFVPSATLTWPNGDATATDVAEVVTDAGGTRIKFTPETGITRTFYYRLKDLPGAGMTAQFLSNQRVPSTNGVPRKIEVTSILKPAFVSYTDNAALIQGTSSVVAATGQFSRPFTNDNTPLLTGTAQPNAMVTLLGLPAGSTPPSINASATGDWQFQIVSAIPDDSYQISVSTMSGGITAISDQVAFTVDTSVPTLPVILQPVVDTRPPLAGSEEPAHRANWDRDGVSNNPAQLKFSNSLESGNGISGIGRYQISVNRGVFQNVTNLTADTSTESLIDLLNGASLIQPGTTNLIHLRAIDVAGNFTVPSRPFWLEYDAVSPKFVGSFTTHAAADTKNIQLISDTVSDSILPIPVVIAARPQVRVTIEDQQFAVRNNQLTARLLVDGQPASRLVTPNLIRYAEVLGDHRNAQVTFDLTPFTPLAGGKEYDLQVRVFDRAGNAVLSDELTVFVSKLGDSTLGAPSTPAHSSLYYLGARLLENVQTNQKKIIVDQQIPVGLSVFIDGQYGNNGNPVSAVRVLSEGRYELTLTNKIYANSAETGGQVLRGDKIGWLRPWQMAFDKSTQTVWFTMEDGFGLGQFDPATGKTTIYDVAMRQNGVPQATDPHGAFFDFNSHLTPRVWFVYRNAAAGGVGRVSYFDIAQQKLFTYGLDQLSSSLNLDEPLSENHAIFVDTRGDVWFTAEEGGNTEAGSLIQLDFDNGSIGGNVGQAIVHQIPLGLGDGESFHVHGIQVVVDQRTNSQYVYFLDGSSKGSNSKQSVVGLLRPADPNNALASTQTDHWYSWKIPVDNTRPHLLFTAIDDNETPGIPEDDRVIFTDPGFSFTSSGKGVVAALEFGNAIDRIRKNALLPTSSPAKYVVVSKLPGADTEASASNQAFVDRQGNVFAVDPQGGIIRFNFDDVTGSAGVISQTAKLTSINDTAAPLQAQITMTQTGLADPLVIDTVFSSDDLLAAGLARSVDRSQDNGVDYYEVGATSERRTEGEGPFRGALNATNVAYGSIAQSDHISTTVFAETARRQMVVVNSPNHIAGVLEGRMAFQVLRDGSVVLTARADGQLLDEQQNLTNAIAARFTNLNSSNLAVSGDVSAVVDGNGRVQVVGKQKLPSGQIRLVNFTYRGAWNSQIGINNPANWSVQFHDAPTDGSLLTSDPTTYIDQQSGIARTLVTTNRGQLLMYEVGKSDPKVIAGNYRQPVYSKVGVVQQGPWTFAYGTNQKGELIEFGFTSDLSLFYAKQVQYSRPADHTERDVRVFQDVEAVVVGQQRHIYATDGNSRLVHVVIDQPRQVAWAENVTKIVAASMSDNTTQTVNGELTSVDTNRDDLAEGYFPFQEAFAGRVYSGLEVLVDSRGNQTVYGTNGGELILFIKRTGQSWRAANLTNDIFSGSGNVDGPDRGGVGQPPRNRVPANAVFGSPGGYITPEGDRHLFQINAEGEVIEYYVLVNEAIPRFHTQNINLRTGF